jgi:hypothetical protein
MKMTNTTIDWTESRKANHLARVESVRKLIQGATLADRQAFERSAARVTDLSASYDYLLTSSRRMAEDCAWLTVHAAAPSDLNPQGLAAQTRDFASAAMECQSIVAWLQEYMSTDEGRGGAQ